MLELDLLARIQADERVTDRQIDRNDYHQGLVGLVQFALYIFGAFFFIRWMHRAHRNVDAIAPSWRRHGTGWAIGGWFVPILGLWRPKQVINDIWRASAGRDACLGEREPGALLLVWWIGFLLSGLLTRFAAASRSDPEPTLDELRDGTIASLASDGVDVVAAILAILVVRATTRRMGAGAAGARDSVAGPWSTPQTT